MFIQIGTTDGEVYTSDVVSIQDTGLTPDEFAVEAGNLESMFQNWDDVAHLSLTVGGNTRYFNPRNVVWGEVVY